MAGITDSGVRLAHKYNPDKHRNKVIGWFMSEKLDGVRAIWDGFHFVTRNGNKLVPPYHMVAQLQRLKLGNRLLDGELYLGRGRFNECSGIVRRKDDEWFGIEFHAFDLYDPCTNRVFYHRYHDLEELINSKNCPSFVKLVTQYSVKTVSCITSKHEEITGIGGEGLMLTNPGANWVGKRTSDLLKVKSFFEIEVTVVDYEGGNGKYTGMIGALKCRTDDNKEFFCGSGLSDSDRIEPGFIGKKITVKYFELSENGIPRFPIFKGIRHDA